MGYQSNAQISQDSLEVLYTTTGSADVSQYAVEVLFPLITYSPTSTSGSQAGISQYVVEVLYSDPSARAYVSQYALEVLYFAGSVDSGSAPPSPTTVTYGWVSIG